jgi:peroxiredoxin
MLLPGDLRLTRALRLPTFTAARQTLLERLTLVLEDGRIEHVFHPVFPPDGHADEVPAWLRAHAAHG